MPSNHLLSLFFAGATVSFGGASLVAPTVEDSPVRDRVEPGAYFRDHCVACHAIPDPELATDRAWLDQVRRTS